jgi:putative NADH-flavin reductase
VGASRGIGRATVARALESGMRVRAFARSAEAIPADHDMLERMPGDARSRLDVARAVEGVDAVVMALGVSETPANFIKPTRLFSDATEVMIDAMKKAEARRLLAVTGIGAGRSRAALSRPERRLADLVLGRIYTDKSRQEDLIEASDLDWTIVRPTLLTRSDRVANYKVLDRPETWHNGVISRASVADFLVRAVQDGSHIRQDVVLTN